MPSTSVPQIRCPNLKNGCRRRRYRCAACGQETALRGSSPHHDGRVIRRRCARRRVASGRGILVTPQRGDHRLGGRISVTRFFVKTVSQSPGRHAPGLIPPAFSVERPCEGGPLHGARVSDEWARDRRHPVSCLRVHEIPVPGAERRNRGAVPGAAAADRDGAGGDDHPGGPGSGSRARAGDGAAVAGAVQAGAASEGAFVAPVADGIRRTAPAILGATLVGAGGTSARRWGR